jgi:uncharacterized protein (TIGR00251 family)
MLLTIKVVPNAKQEKVVQEPGRLKVYLSAPAVEGKANVRLVKFLAEHYKVRKRDVVIKSGLRSRDKLVEIAGI